MAYGTINAEQLTTQSGYTLGAGNASSFKNRILNGSMVLDQRNAGASITPTNGQYSVDRWRCLLTQASKYTAQQNAGAVTPPVGFKNYLGITSSSAYAIAVGDIFDIYQAIEGFNTADLGWGTASAATVTLSFWVRSSLTGTFGGALQNSASNRSYPFTYTISSANTWEQKTITIAGDTSGTWSTDNSGGIYVYFGFGVGSTYSGTAGAWAGANYQSATGATSVVGTNGATFYITGVQLEVGTVATSFDYRSYGTELALCQRYLPTLTASAAGTVSTIGAGLNTTSARVVIPFAVTPRVSPTGVTVVSVGNFGLTSTGSGGVVASAIAFDSASFTGASVTVTVASGMTANGAHVMYQSSPAQLQFTGCEL